MGHAGFMIKTQSESHREQQNPLVQSSVLEFSWLKSQPLVQVSVLEPL